MPRVKITVDMLDEARPVARRGLMLIDLTCDMTEYHIFQAIQSIRESIPGTTWDEWMEKWAEEELSVDYIQFPHIAKPE